MIDELVEGTTQRGFTGEDDFLEHGVLGGPHHPFGVAIHPRALRWDAIGFVPGFAEHLAELLGEDRIAIHHDVGRSDLRQKTVICHGQIAGTLRHPRRIGMFGDTDDGGAPRGEMDGDQDVQQTEVDTVQDAYRGEIDSDGGGGIKRGDGAGCRGVSPALRCWWDTITLQNEPYGAGRNDDAEFIAFGADAPASPGIVAEAVLQREWQYHVDYVLANTLRRSRRGAGNQQPIPPP